MSIVVSDIYVLCSRFLDSPPALFLQGFCYIFLILLHFPTVRTKVPNTRSSKNNRRQDFFFFFYYFTAHTGLAVCVRLRAAADIFPTPVMHYSNEGAVIWVLFSPLSSAPLVHVRPNAKCIGASVKWLLNSFCSVRWPAVFTCRCVLLWLIEGIKAVQRLRAQLIISHFTLYLGGRIRYWHIDSIRGLLHFFNL